jgi:hypothetical protein
LSPNALRLYPFLFASHHFRRKHRLFAGNAALGP